MHIGFYLSKNFLSALVLALMWMGVGVFFVIGVHPYYDLPGRLFWTLFPFVPAFFITLMIIRFLKGEIGTTKTTEAPSRSNRVQRWLESLDDDELDTLRDRLQEDEQLEMMLTKRKNGNSY
jgi:hypothetical protein